MLSVRDNISANDRALKDKNIIRQLLLIDEFRNAELLMLYASFRSEVNTWQIIKELFARGKKALLPKVDRASGILDIYEVFSMENLTRSAYGIMEPDPAKCRRVDVSQADLILVPGAVFDLSCNRIGYGKGYYDRLLKDRRSKAVGLAYDEQIVGSLPTEPHDIVLDMIVTDKRVIKNG